MSEPPVRPKIYHIVHVDRLPSIVADGCLWSDAEVAKRASSGTSIGMGTIKARRLTLSVHCHPGDHVGEYVPFYFCPRSIMPYVIHCANHQELAYRGGQGTILHLEADLHEVVAWAEGNMRCWAFSLSNAGAYYTQFRSRLDQLGEVNWEAVAATDFRSADIKEGKQAEFLVHHKFAWEFVRRIGVLDPTIARQVSTAVHGAAHRPVVEIRRQWYF
jgi:hypothetical protein